MRRRATALGHHEWPATRIAWWVSFVATLVIVAVLGIARSAQASTSPGADSSLAVPELEIELEGEGEAEEEADLEEEECEVAEEEGEEGQDCEEEGNEEGVPSECMLSDTVATVSANPEGDKVRLSVRYTASSAAAVKVDLRLRGGKGPMGLDEDRGHFSRTGVFRDTESLSEAQMEKVAAAKTFTVSLQAVNAPRYCHRYLDGHLTVRRATPGGLTWSEPAARLAARRSGA